MRFLVDECTGPKVAKWLLETGHDVFSVYDESRGISDEVVIAKANNEDRILITNDKDFGEKIFRGQHPHKGVILLRLQDERPSVKIEVISDLLERYSDRLPGNYIVVTEEKVRFARG